MKSVLLCPLKFVSAEFLLPSKVALHCDRLPNIHISIVSNTSNRKKNNTFLLFVHSVLKSKIQVPIALHGLARTPPKSHFVKVSRPAQQAHSSADASRPTNINQRRISPPGSQDYNSCQDKSPTRLRATSTQLSQPSYCYDLIPFVGAM